MCRQSVFLKVERGTYRYCALQKRKTAIKERKNIAPVRISKVENEEL